MIDWKQKIKDAKWCFYVYDYTRFFGNIDIFINKDKCKFFVDLDDNLYFDDHNKSGNTCFEIDKIFLFDTKENFIKFLFKSGLPKNDNDYEMLLDCEIDNKTMKQFKLNQYKYFTRQLEKENMIYSKTLITDNTYANHKGYNMHINSNKIAIENYNQKIKKLQGELNEV